MNSSEKIKYKDPLKALHNHLSQVDIYSFMRCILFFSYIIYTFQNIGIVLPQIKPYYALFSVIILATLYHIMWTSDIRSLKKSLHYYGLFLLLWLWSMLSITWSIAPAQSLQHGIKFGLFCLLGLAVTTMFAGRQNQCTYTIVMALAINFTITAIGFVYIFFSSGGIDIIATGSMSAYINFMSNVTFGFTGGKNLLSSWAAFQLTFTVPLLRKCYNKTILSNIVAAACIIVLGLTISRIAMYCVLIFLFFGFWKLEFKIRMRIFMGLFFSFIMLLCAFQANDPGFLDKYYERIASPIKVMCDNKLNINEIKDNDSNSESYNIDRGVYGRIVLWQLAIRSLKTHSVLTGTGAGTVYGKGIDNEDNYHNQPLQFLVQLGIPGLILFIMWNIRVLLSQIKLYKITSGQDRFLAWILIINMIIYSVKGLFMAQYLDLEIWTIIIITSLLSTSISKDRVADE